MKGTMIFPLDPFKAGHTQSVELMLCIFMEFI